MYLWGYGWSYSPSMCAKLAMLVALLSLPWLNKITIFACSRLLLIPPEVVFACNYLGNNIWQFAKQKIVCSFQEVCPPVLVTTPLHPLIHMSSTFYIQSSLTHVTRGTDKSSRKQWYHHFLVITLDWWLWERIANVCTWLGNWFIFLYTAGGTLIQSFTTLKMKYLYWIREKTVNPNIPVIILQCSFLCFVSADTDSSLCFR